MPLRRQRQGSPSTQNPNGIQIQIQSERRLFHEDSFVHSLKALVDRGLATPSRLANWKLLSPQDASPSSGQQRQNISLPLTATFQNGTLSMVGRDHRLAPIVSPRELARVETYVRVEKNGPSATLNLSPQSILDENLSPLPRTFATDVTSRRKKESCNACNHAKPWRDFIFQYIAEELQVVLRSDMDSFWDVISENMIVYPFSVHFTHQALQWIDLAPPPIPFRAKTINGLDLHKFIRLVKQWMTWTPLQCFTKLDEIKSALSDCLLYIELLAHSVESGHYLFEWANGIRRSLGFDIQDMERELAVFINEIKFHDDGPLSTLSEKELDTFMNVLQTMIDSETPSRRQFERFLKKLVFKSGTLPSYLFLSYVERLGTNPVAGGGFADIWKGYARDRLIALKVIRVFDHMVEREDAYKSFCKEAMIWRQLNHPNILPFYGVCLDNFSPRLAMVSPWMENGHILTYLKKHGTVNRTDLIIGIASGLSYLHNLVPIVIHGDLRGTNILVDNRGCPRLADFGLAKIVDTQSSSASSSFGGMGSMRWQAPELLVSSRFHPSGTMLSADMNSAHVSAISKETDIYAFASVCLEVFTEEVPFAHLRDGDVLMEVIIRRRRPARPGTESPATSRGLSNQMWTIMQACWETDPSVRPTIDEVINLLSTPHMNSGIRAWRDSLSGDILKVDIFSVPHPVVILQAVRGKRHPRI